MGALGVEFVPRQVGGVEDAREVAGARRRPMPMHRAAMIHSDSADTAGESSSSAWGSTPGVGEVARRAGQVIARGAREEGDVGGGQRAEPQVKRR